MAFELVGRALELAALRQMLLTEGRSIVTLWGSGGIGKTRLARELVRRDGPGFPGEVHFCALSGTRTADEILAVIGDVLALGPEATRTHDDGWRRIAASLSTRGRMLVVLDNVEQVLADVAHALTLWTTLAPEASFLVTSRELLGVAGETPLELSALRVPGEGASAMDSDAVRLLVDRARAVRPDFDAAPEVLADIVTRLDGIPLALELAAARLAVMSAEQLRDRLGRRFEVLVAPHAGLEQRQRTLQGAIDWSWELLDPAERLLLAQLSVFRGGFELEGVEAVATREGPARVADLLGALRQKSLVSQVAATPGASRPGSLPRFALLESIRDYAKDKLGDGATVLRDRHAAYFAGRASDAADAGDGAWFARERDNLLAVLDHFLDDESGPRARVAMALLPPLQRLLAMSGSSAMLVDVGARVLAAAGRFDVEPLVRMRALEACGVASFAVGQLTDAFARLTLARTLAAGGSLEDQARLGNLLGMVLQAQGRIEEALALQEEALGLAERAGASLVRGHCLGSLGGCHLMMGDVAHARQRLEQSLALHRESGDVLAQARGGARLAFAMQNAGDGEAALAELDRALARVADARGGRGVEGLLLGYRGNVLRERGEWTQAHAMYERASSLLRLVGDRRYELAFQMDRAIAFELEGRFDEARAVLEAAAATAHGIGDSTLTTLIAGYRALAHATLGDHAGARAALARAGDTADAGARRSLAVQTIHCALLEAREGKGDAARGRVNDALGAAREALTSVEASRSGEHPRLAARLLRRTVDAMAPPDGALVVTPSRERVRLPGGTWLDVSDRPAVQRVLSALVDARLRAPGAVLSVDDLVRAGWPDERLLRRAGQNRLRVLLTALRARGLRDLLQSAPGGYFLAPSVPVVLGVPLED